MNNTPTPIDTDTSPLDVVPGYAEGSAYVALYVDDCPLLLTLGQARDLARQLSQAAVRADELADSIAERGRG
jgi:hypothetical protein